MELLVPHCPCHTSWCHRYAEFLVSTQQGHKPVCTECRHDCYPMSSQLTEGDRWRLTNHALARFGVHDMLQLEDQAAPLRLEPLPHPPGIEDPGADDENAEPPRAAPPPPPPPQTDIQILQQSVNALHLHVHQIQLSVNDLGARLDRMQGPTLNDIVQRLNSMQQTITDLESMND